VSSGPLRVALIVADAIETCGLKYLVGGSLASSIGGEPRSTLDVDIVVSMSDADVGCLLRALGSDFYADDAAFHRAVGQRASVNIIHQPTSIKVDLFIAGGTAIDDEQLERRRWVQVMSSPERSLYFHTPEDILLQKLRWYRLSGEQSDRQWRDVLGIVLVQAGALDVPYLRRQAETLGVLDLLDRASAAGRQR
jgi:hypothetical protein